MVYIPKTKRLLSLVSMPRSVCKLTFPQPIGQRLFGTLLGSSVLAHVDYLPFFCKLSLIRFRPEAVKEYIKRLVKIMYFTYILPSCNLATDYLPVFVFLLKICTRQWHTPR